MHPSRAGGDTARGRPVGGPGDRAGLRRYADAWRSRPAVDGVARSRGSAPHSRPAPANRTRRCRTPSRTPSRGTAPCATAWLWLSRLAAAAATSAQGEAATWRDGGDRPTGVGGRRRASRWAAITRTRRPTPARLDEIETLATGSCRCDTLGARVRGVRPRRPPGARRRSGLSLSRGRAARVLPCRARVARVLSRRRQSGRRRATGGPGGRTGRRRPLRGPHDDACFFLTHPSRCPAPRPGSGPAARSGARVCRTARPDRISPKRVGPRTSARVATPYRFVQKTTY